LKTIKSQSEVTIISEKVQRMRVKTLIEFLKMKKFEKESCHWMLHKEDFEAYGVNINYKHIEKAKQKYPQIEFKQADCGNKAHNKIKNVIIALFSSQIL